MREHSSLQPQDLPAHYPKINQRKQHRQPRRVFGQTPVARLGMTQLLLDHPKRVLHFRPDARPGLLQIIHNRAFGRIFVWRSAFAWAHGHMPVRLDGLRLFTPGHALVARISEHVALFSMHQGAGLCHVGMLTLAAVPTTLCTRPESASTPM